VIESDDSEDESSIGMERRELIKKKEQGRKQEATQLIIQSVDSDEEVISKLRTPDRYQKAKEKEVKKNIPEALSVARKCGEIAIANSYYSSSVAKKKTQEALSVARKCGVNAIAKSYDSGSESDNESSIEKTPRMKNNKILISNRFGETGLPENICGKNKVLLALDNKNKVSTTKNIETTVEKGFATIFTYVNL
jgi:hypothetical protein